MTLTPQPIDGVVVEVPCREEWTWDEFWARCELTNTHTRHRWTYHDDHKGVDVVIEWKSFWGELPETAWMCPDCHHLHKGADENAENPHYSGNGSCKELIERETWSGQQKLPCHCPRRRPNKESDG